MGGWQPERGGFALRQSLGMAYGTGRREGFGYRRGCPERSWLGVLLAGRHGRARVARATPTAGGGQSKADRWMG
jgi:hypothetical protein